MSTDTDTDTDTETDVDALVIGAGPAGLAAAATLQAKRRRVVVLEKTADVGASWRSHYARLHLHTVKSLSALPGLPFPDTAPRYVPRAGVVDYLAAYAREKGIAPRFGEEAASIVRDAGGRWRTTTRSGKSFVADDVVVATGANHEPFAPKVDGEDAFAGGGGRVLHSRDYRDAAPFAGQRVLVVGMGNTGAEIALDLAEQRVAVALSVRSPINIVRRDVLGRPTQQTSILLSRLPAPVGDWLARFFCDVTVGDISRHGLPATRLSPLRQLREHGRTPVIDVGTLARIASGEIAVFGGLRRLMAGGAEFVDGRNASFDAVVLATGYRAGIAALFPEVVVPVDDRGLPIERTGRGALAGIHFIGFDLRQPGGLLRAIGQEALAVAERIGAVPAPSRSS